MSEEVFDDDCRRAIRGLNHRQSRRVEHLGDGYDCLQSLVFAPTIKDILVKYIDGVIEAWAKHDSLVKSTRAEVENALTGIDTADLKASFRCAFSFSIPPLTLYRNYRPGAYSYLVFGVPLVNLTTNEDLVPKVMRMCIEEVERRGLNTHKIYYSSDPIFPAEVLQLRHRFENETSFSFSFTDNIHFVAFFFIKNFLDHLPGSLFMLSLQDYRQYRQNRARYTKDGFSLLRSKIRELHPVQRASLGALSRHLLRVASHSNKNSMTVRALAFQFAYPVLRGHCLLQDGVRVKDLVMEDLIQNAHSLFDEQPSPSEPVPSPNVAETTATITYDSFALSPEYQQTAELEAMGFTTRHGPEGILTSTQSSFSSLSMVTRFTPPTTLPSPLQGFPLSKMPRGVETTIQNQVIPVGKGTNGVETMANSTPAEVMSVPLTFVDYWRIPVPQSRLAPHREALTTPRNPPESTLYSTSDLPHSSATSLQTIVAP